MWAGIEGAPNTQFLAAEGTFYRKKIGWGVQIENDQFGLLSQKKVLLNSTYRIRTGKKSFLAFGPGFGIKQHVFDGTKASAYQMQDDAIAQGQMSQVKPTVNLGVFMQSPRYQIGLSVENALGYDINYTGLPRPVSARAKERFYFIAGVHLPLTKGLELIPLVQVKYEHNNPFQVDFTPMIEYNSQLSFGVGYRHGESVSFICQNKFSQKFRIGYAYDYQTNGLNGVNNGSHELMISYSLGTNNPIFSNPRYF